MPRYDYQTSYFHKKLRARKVHVVAVVAVLLAAILAVWVGFDILRERFRKDSKQSESSEVVIQSTAVTSFRSPYFEFQAEETWREISGENAPNRFVYRRFDGPLVTDEFVVEVMTMETKSLAETTSTRSLGVQINQDGTLKLEAPISPHCSEVYPATSTALPKVVKMLDVDFLCNPNSNQYDVLVGVVGGGTELLIPRPGGQKTSYFMEYKSLQTSPNANRLIDLLATFKTR